MLGEMTLWREISGRFACLPASRDDDRFRHFSLLIHAELRSDGIKRAEYVGDNQRWQAVGSNDTMNPIKCETWFNGY
jgi:hypothetical protein